MPKNGVVATDKNTKGDQILIDKEGTKWVVWETNRGSYTVIRQFDGAGDFVCQSGVVLSKGEYKHTGKLWVEPPPKLSPPLDTDSEGSLRNARAGWVDKEGRLYTCSYSGHRELSFALCYHRGLRDHPEFSPHFGSMNDNEVACERAGYIKLTLAMVHGPDPYWEEPQVRNITQRQYDTVWAWCNANKQPMPKWLNENTLAVEDT